MKNLEIKTINPLQYQESIIPLLKQLNPNMEKDHLKSTLNEMSKSSNYTCFGLFQNATLVGMSSGWTTVRIYCGKQLELDNVIIEPSVQSSGLGTYFIDEIKKWSSLHKYQTIGLNTYVENARSHKFYFNQGFRILGFHFEHKLNQT